MYIAILHLMRENTLYVSALPVRMLIPTTELGRFDSMVMPFELEAYDILKSRSCKWKNILHFSSVDIANRHNTLCRCHKSNNKI